MTFNALRGSKTTGNICELISDLLVSLILVRELNSLNFHLFFGCYTSRNDRDLP